MGGVSGVRQGYHVPLPGLLYADELVLCSELEGDLMVMVGQFAEVCRRGLRVNAAKSKVMVLSGKEGLSVRFT